MSWSRRDLFLVVYLFFVVLISVWSLLFGGKFWLLLEASGVGSGLFSAWMFLVVLVLLGGLGFVFWFVRTAGELVVEKIVVKKKEEVVVPLKKSLDEGRRLSFLDDVKKEEVPVVKVVKGDDCLYYDNGFFDSNGEFHLYDEENNNGGGD